MDEAHIRSDVAYRGGKFFGPIDNPIDPATTVFSLLVSSLMRKCSTIVRFIPLGSFSASYLHPIIMKAINDIEACGLFVEAVMQSTRETHAHTTCTTRSQQTGLADRIIPQNQQDGPIDLSLLGLYQEQTSPRFNNSTLFQPSSSE